MIPPTDRSQEPILRGRRVGRSVLVRADGAGCTHQLLDWLARQRVQYLVGFTLPDDFAVQLRRLDRSGVWQPAYDADGQIRDGAFVAEATGLLDLSSWPAGMRVIVREERPHPGAQLRITDVDGNRVTAFATNTSIGGPGMQLADLELRHRRRARYEDRIRLAKDTGLHSHLAYRKGHRYKPTSARSRDVCATAVVISSPNSGVSNVADRPFRLGRRHVI